MLLLAACLGVPVARPAGPHRLFLPAVSGGAPRGLLGVELATLDPALTAAELGPGWVRRSGLRWRDVEPLPGGDYRWDTPNLRALEAQLAAAARRGQRVILVLHGSPAWAVAPFRADCAPVAAEFRDDYARFVAAAARRYSAPPFNVRYWELGNEPDAFVFTADAPFGCWGRPDEELYGGQAYGELLKTAYPALKAVAPQAVVLNGGLLLDKPYDPQTGAGRSGRFLEGMLATGASSAFDLLAFHSYSFYDGTPDGTTGPADWKPGYLRALMARYGVSKPLINTEGALLCPTATPACAEAQGHAVARLAVRALRDDLQGMVWYLYDNDSFNNSGLIDPASGAPRPAARAFAHVARAIAGQRYAGQLVGLPAGVEAHQLAGAGRTTLVLWANTPTAATLALPPGAAPRCAEWDGAPLACAADGAGLLALEARPGARFVSWATP